jgi:hypothetical protein
LQQTAGDQLPRLRKVIEGPLIASDDQRMLIALPVAMGRGETNAMLQQRVAIQLTDVLGVERKLLNKKETGLIVAGAGAALLAFISYYVSGQFGGTTSPYPEPGQGESIQVPFRFIR